jgi:hypothetical protein
VLRNPVPVEALYDRATAHEVTLRNLLQRKGYDGLEEVREEGREEGQRQILIRQIRHRFGELSEAHSARLASAGVETLGLWAECILTASSIEDLFNLSS